MNLDERLKNRLEEINLVKQNPEKYLTESYAALTEDLKYKDVPFSRDWIIAKVLENQAKYLLEASTVGDNPDLVFTTISMPLVRKVFSKLIALDLVSVQPISQSTAKIFYLDFVYGSGANQNLSIYDVRDQDYATSSEGSSSIAEINFVITSQTVTAIEKKLKAVWTKELEDDLMAYHKLNAEDELMNILQQEIQNEIDGLVISALISAATGGGSVGIGTGAGNVNWNATGYLPGDTTTTFRRDYRKTIYEAIVDASNLIFKKRFRYATWIIGHPDAVAYLEKLEEFKISPELEDTSEQAIGRHLVGTLNKRFHVYKDPFFPYNNVLLLGYKGNNWTDAVGFYAPYIPLYTTPKLIDPNDFKPRRGLMSRFAYGALIKDGLATVTITQS